MSVDLGMEIRVGPWESSYEIGSCNSCRRGHSELKVVQVVVGTLMTRLCPTCLELLRRELTKAVKRG